VLFLRHYNWGYELGLQRWIGRDISEKILQKEEEIKKLANSRNKFNFITKGWLFRKGFNRTYPEPERLNFILTLLFNPKEEANLLERIFQELRDFLDEKINNEITLERYLDKIVQLYKN
jgi:cell shape-determining protein MreC